MNITFLGHAGLYIQTRYGSILCDPWFNPAYFASWFPFPDNATIPYEQIAHPTYLYVSHLHQDHFDTHFLYEHVSKETIVILPEYPLNLLERRLRELGFTHFLQTRNAQAVENNGLRLVVMVMISPIDGPLGDSCLLVDDGEARIFNQNDARPLDLDLLKNSGPVDVHFVQFSGALWYPMVYHYPEEMARALGRKKRENEMARALRYIHEIGARLVIPAAGPPCFLDDHLFRFNDFDRNPSNTFPDQSVFLEYMQAHGKKNGLLAIPGSVITVQKDRCVVEHPLPDSHIQAIFHQKRSYLEYYKARQQPVIDTQKASWPRGQVDILTELQAWFEPLMARANLTAVGINGRVLIDCDVIHIVLDFHTRKISLWQHEEWTYRFHIDAPLLEYCILHHEEDWVNQIFLSCRFEAQRKGVYNEYVYTFFKCLSQERLHYVEDYYARRASMHQLWESHGYRFQRRCPHLNADLSRFSTIENGILTCTMHGWQFELATGRCLTTEHYRLFVRPAPTASDDFVENTAPNPAGGKQNVRCSHCWFAPSERLHISPPEIQQS